MSDARLCPALFIAAPASGQGKTTVTAALARYHLDQGRQVRVFKTGPDFLDPMLLERASGHPVYPLDLWLVGEAQCRRLLFEAAADADLILIEGVMGLFDGTPPGADLAQRFGVPVLAVIDASAMAQTFAALAYGLKNFRPGLPFAGVVANRLGSAAHGALIRDALPPSIPYLGGVRRDAGLALPERHLGLVQADEIDDLERRLDDAAHAIETTGLTQLPEPVVFAATETKAVPQSLQGVRIGVARDAAFGFIYPANIDLLRALGAELLFFSPLRDTALPAVDSIWLPGGYPELHLAQLSANDGMRRALRAHFMAHKPILAECGGMLYLLDELRDADGNAAPMAGLLPGKAIMERQLMALGLQTAPLPEGHVRAHTFHHSRSELHLEPDTRGITQQGTATGEALYRLRRLTAGYLHLYFPSNPDACAALFQPTSGSAAHATPL